MIIFISSVIGLLRVLGLKHIAYQAVAHLWTGGLIVAGWNKSPDWKLSPLKWNYCTQIVVILSILEIICAVFGTVEIL